MPTPDIEVGRMLSVLEHHRVAFVVIGGFAIELHDVAVPPTRDIDITPATGSANLLRLADALRELDAKFRVEGGPAAGVKIPGGISAKWLADMVSVALVTDAGPLDINLRPDGTTGYDDLARQSVKIEFDGHSVPTAALEDVLRSKEAAGRSKDIRVIPALRAHLRRRRR
ncbi:MAG: hypothetical protein AAB198_01125 [Actinomycetota bacterium]|mgnify:FL=1